MSSTGDVEGKYLTTSRLVCVRNRVAVSEEQFFAHTTAKMQAALLVNESITEVRNGAKTIEGKKFFADMREKYGR